MKIEGRIYRGINFVGQDARRSPDHQRWNDDAENQDLEFQEADVPARKDIVDEIDCPGNGPEHCQEQCPVLDDLCPADFFGGQWGRGLHGHGGAAARVGPRVATCAG